MLNLETNNFISEKLFQTAQNSLSEWSSLSVKQRAKCIKRLRMIIVERQDEIRTAIISDTQKPINEVINQEIIASLEMLRFLEKSYVKWLKPESFYFFMPGFWTKTNKIFYEPMGIIGIIGPSNFPFSLPIMQTVSALLCGNAVFLKPSEKSPATSKLIDKLFNEADFSRGVVNLVFGGEEVANKIISHKSISKIIFTGSTKIGKKIAALCGAHFKTCILELGGNNPAIVCDDANIKLSVKGILWSALYSNGKSCVGTNVIFVHSKILDTFLQEFIKEIKQVRFGNPFAPDTEFSESKRCELSVPSEKLLHEIIADAEKVYSFPINENESNDENWDKPKVIVNSKCINQILNEDFPIPIIFIQSFDSVENVIELINNSNYGLGASVWSKNISEAKKISAKLKMGIIWINDTSVGLPQFPWGGIKSSGWGRLYSKTAIAELTNVKVISCDYQRWNFYKTWWFPYSKKKFNLFSNIISLSGKNKIKTLIEILRRYISNTN